MLPPHTSPPMASGPLGGKATKPTAGLPLTPASSAMGLASYMWKMHSIALWACTFITVPGIKPPHCTPLPLCLPFRVAMAITALCNTGPTAATMANHSGSGATESQVLVYRNLVQHTAKYPGRPHTPAHTSTPQPCIPMLFAANV